MGSRPLLTFCILQSIGIQDTPGKYLGLNRSKRRTGTGLAIRRGACSNGRISLDHRSMRLENYATLSSRISMTGDTGSAIVEHLQALMVVEDRVVMLDENQY
jgi:hypothetical protein